MPRFRRKPKRMHDANTMIQAVKHISDLRQKSMEYAPTAAAAQAVPTHEGYCVKCRDKKTFEVKEEAPLKNGGIHRKGECPDCGTKIGAFAKGMADASA